MSNTENKIPTAEELFQSKAYYNHWLLELKDYEKELIKNMMIEFATMHLETQRNEIAKKVAMNIKRGDQDIHANIIFTSYNIEENVK